MSNQLQSVIAVVPAAGVGSRMKADRPKQYLQIHGKTILEHTVEKLLSHPQMSKIVVAVSGDDPYYPELPLNLNPQVIRVSGGTERADSVLSALDYIAQQQLSDWVMVHDAARPCIQLSDIDKLISGAMTHDVGAILAAPVRDTMKRGAQGQIEHTVDRIDLWHALTPQMFRSKPLRKVLSEALQQGVSITDEASAFEWKGLSPALIAGRSDNFKITQPEDLALAEFYLSQNKE
ncbi:2-C-methyl-D-erythritol 4-phosphate cytidylyltransferase [Vibrio lentus]|uniref:2-C-methyl-D-erythritol 4-phosphate cytidylyltransferase n=1 Tax=Vibrio lentus TaxID=136468 RepID=UPI000C85BF83|nr:2-C-methyl-D-erythritol 4-phosphate cytidylyltransferase [Vibrio lentus]PMJ84331.1 2-C-methyl-D-erythritol 4-phosphate cytidylyltransferase [Vibrio lentus]PMN39813.1 2-C-methyl-D-erythritol 4-phosphate cytidylyltransferase [Vibrio lentus]PMN62357.1 2-C-methyl-D-erythritol 4-phosphate cytidylyltransferase [Vibrio lentus]